MPVRIWSHLCDYVIVGADNRVSIIGEADVLWITTLPAVQPLLFVVTKWGTVPGESFRHKVSLIDPRGAEVMNGGESICRAERDSHTTVTRFAGIPILLEGEFCFDEIVDGLTVHTIPLQARYK